MFSKTTTTRFGEPVEPRKPGMAEVAEIADFHNSAFADSE